MSIARSNAEANEEITAIIVFARFHFSHVSATQPKQGWIDASR
jgi:hypothetical protein